MPSEPGEIASKDSVARPGRLRRALSWLSANDPVLGAAMALLVVYYVVTPGVFQGKASGDGWFALQYLRGIVFEHTLDMKKLIPEFERYFGTMPATGRMPNRCPIGPVFFWIPTYLVGAALYGVARLFGWAATNNGGTTFHAWCAGLGTLFGVLLGWRATYRLLLRHAGKSAARAGSIVVIWATPLAWYAVTQPMYQHGLAFAVVMLLIDHWDATRGKLEARRFMVLGALAGGAMAMRSQLVFFLAIPCGEIAWRVVRGPERARWVRGGMVFILFSLIAFAPQLAVWQYYSGAPRPPQVEAIFWKAPYFIVALFSTRSGLFPWTPIAYVALLGLALHVRRLPSVAWGLFIVFLLELYVVACAWVIHGAYGYGARRLSETMGLVALGVALLWRACEGRRWARRALTFAIAGAIAFNVVAMELQRNQKTPSSGTAARTFSAWLSNAHAPAPVVRFFEKVGDPFVQPAGWLFALTYGVPAATFEGVVGNWFLDRDWLYYALFNQRLEFKESFKWFVPSGVAIDPSGRSPSVVSGKVRLLLPFFVTERITFTLVGKLADGAKTMRWNGQPVALTRADNNGLATTVPVENVRRGVNDVELELPLGSTLDRIDLYSTTRWWEEEKKR